MLLNNDIRKNLKEKDKTAQGRKPKYSKSNGQSNLHSNHSKQNSLTQRPTVSNVSLNSANSSSDLDSLESMHIWF